MTGRLDLFRNHLRVAAISTAVVAVVYLALVAVVDLVAVQNVHREITGLLEHQLTLYQDHPRLLGAPIAPPPGSDVTFDSPPVVWVISNGQLVAKTQSAPDLPKDLYKVSSSREVEIGNVQMVVLGGPWQGGWLVVGERTNFVSHATAALFTAEEIAVGPLLIFVFVGALLISRRAVAPVEAARRRQLAFAADASHELRTPLAVIEAETSLALQMNRPAKSYKETLERIGNESTRLHTLVDQLLWLARLDAETVAPNPELVDLREQMEDAVTRFAPLAEQRSQTLKGSRGQAFVSAQAEWIEHLWSVLLDNAVRYAPVGGTILVAVEERDGRVRLSVDDSGPGIPAADRTHIFDRFRRATDQVGGAGLGLAIADAVVRATGGRWELDDSPLGGARMAVSWPAPRVSRASEPPVTHGDAALQES